MLVVWQLGWVEIELGYYTTCWAAGVMAEWAEQVGRQVELENLSQHNQLPDDQHHPVYEVLTYQDFCADVLELCLDLLLVLPDHLRRPTAALHGALFIPLLPARKCIGGDEGLSNNFQNASDDKALIITCQ